MPKFVPRQRKHKVLSRRSARNGTASAQSADTNAIEILPKAGVEREKKKAEMKAALKSQQPAMSSKKQKRLDKYIVRIFAI